jgi:uncharacterized protein (DUF433 family)
MPAERMIEVRCNQCGKVNGCYRITGTRVSLDSIVYAYRNGEDAESITDSFSVLTIEQVRAAIAFYETHREEIDCYLERMRAEYEAKRQAARDADPLFYQKIADARCVKRPQLKTA